MQPAEQYDDLVQRELEIGGGGNGDLFARVRRLACDKQATKPAIFTTSG